MGTTERILQVLIGTVGVEVPSADTDLVAAGLLDSLTLVTLLVELEQEFGIQLPVDGLDPERIRSASRLAVLVDEVRGGRSDTSYTH